MKNKLWVRKKRIWDSEGSYHHIKKIGGSSKEKGVKLEVTEEE